MEFSAHIVEFPAEGLAPTQAFLRIARAFGRKHTFFLESIFDPSATELSRRFARLSIIVCEPVLVVKSRKRRCELDGERAVVAEVKKRIEREFRKSGRAFLLPEGKDPLHFLKAVMSCLSVETGVSRFSFGPIGYVAYDFARFLERLPEKLPDALRLPETFFVIHRNAVIFDHATNRVHLVSHSGGGKGSSLEKLVNTLRHGRELALDTSIPKSTTRSNVSEGEFARAVVRAQQHIKAGDIFQVVLSRRIEVSTPRDPLAVYFDLREINPSPYMFYLDFGDFHFLGASPEVHVRLENGLIEMRPIAGTRGRGKDAAEEMRITRELLQNAKELAEHVMLVDLCRNDVGRVAKFGSVRVPDLLVVEKYSHVQHLVSHVTGRLREGNDAFDVFRATFPAGTVTGAPKVRAMEIIEELEKSRRGPYGGAVGYFDLKGNMDTCIAIRAVLMKKGRAFVQAGAGIVLDSIPRGEWIETRRKANACIKALTGRELEER
ncbi:MAG: anthranilate synthase component I family protein [Candidatus Micrarchaeia archaeon]